MAGVPSHKLIPGTNFTVDGFRYPQPWVKAYFLSHAHSDHYTGLNENWSAGPIYCSPVTAALAEHLTGVPAQYLHPLQINTRYAVEGVQVILIDANHCPGAVQLLFELPDGSKHIHCGDMRYCRQMQENPHLVRFRGANTVYLDTTYCRPRHTFPAQETAVEFVASRIHQLLQEDGQADSECPGIAEHTAAEGTPTNSAAEPATNGTDDVGLPVTQQLPNSTTSTQHEQQPAGQQVQQQQAQMEGDTCCDSQVTAGEQLGFRRLYLISTYVIGKERLLMAVARRTGKRLLVTQRKLEVLRRIGLSEADLSSCFTTQPHETPIHVLRWGVLGDTWPYFRPNYTNMEQARTRTGAQEVVGFVPTGWLHEMNKAAAKGTFPSCSKGSCTVWLIPYSEHSSFVELKEYVAWLRPKQVIPTVNVGEPGAAGDKHRSSMLQHFRGLLDETSNKAAFLARMASAANMAVMAVTADSAETTNGDTADTGAGRTAEPAQGAAAAAADGDDDGNTAEDAAGDSSAGFWVCEAPTGPITVEAQFTAAGGGGGLPQPAEALLAQRVVTSAGPAEPAAAAGYTEPGSDRQVMAAAMGEGQGTAAPAAVELLLAIAGPDSLLSVSDAQQLLVAAKGDANAAMNAFLDDSYTRSKRHAAAQIPSAGGGSSTDGRKQQQKQQKSISGENRKSSSKQIKQAAAAGQAVITAYFGPDGSRAKLHKKQQVGLTHNAVPQAADKDPEQQHQQQQQQQARPPSPAAAPVHLPEGGAAAAGSELGVNVVLPWGAGKPARPAPAGSTAAAALQPLATGVSQQLTSTATAHAAEAGVPSPDVHYDSEVLSHEELAALPAQPAYHDSAAAAAVAALGTSAAVQRPTQHLATGEGTLSGFGSRLLPAEQAPAGPAGEQQLQQRSPAKQSWAAVFPGALTPPAKRKKNAAAARAATQVIPDTGQAAAAVAQQQSMLLDQAAVSLSTPEASRSAGPMMGTSSSSSASSITKAMRDAPLLPLTQYNPLTDACWPPGAAAPYLALALTLAAVDATSSRLKIADGLTNLFRSLMLLAPGEVTAAAYLICGKIAPEYACGCELNVGGGAVSAALREVCGVSRNQLRDMYAQHGDLGDVAQACRRRQSSLLAPPPLTISGVFNSLHSLAAQAGQGAAGRRHSTVAKLLRCCRDVETKYLVRTLVQNLRVGAGWKSVLGPLAKAALLHRSMMQAAGLLLPTQQQQQQRIRTAALDPAALATAAQYAGKSATKVTKQQLEAAAAAAAAAYHTCPNLGILVDVLMRFGPEGLATRVQLTCGVPVKPMLARPGTSTADALQQLAATAAAAGGKRPGRSAAPGKRVGQGLPAAAAATVVAEAVGSDAEDASDVEVDEADDVVLTDHAVSDVRAVAATTAVAVAGEGTVSAGGAAATSYAVRSGLVLEAASPAELSVLAEYKYDGQRAQIHVGQDRQVSIFSRNCEDRTHSFPDVAAAMLAAVSPAALPLVIDTELAAVDRTDGNRIRAFQELASRPRGSAAAAASGPGSGSNAARSASVASTADPSSSTGGQKTAISQPLKQQKLDRPLAAAPGDMELLQQQQAAQPQLQAQQSHESGIDICIFVFDALCVGGVDMMGHSLRERRAALLAALPGTAPGVVQLAEGVEVQAGSTAEAAAAEGEKVLATTAPDCMTYSAETVEQLSSATVGVVEDAGQLVTDFFFKALAAGTEGLMLKLLDGPGSVYQPAKRGLSWIKLKRDYLEGLADSIDLVPIGAWQGQGRKVKWYSPFLLAVYDPASETFQSLCRCMSGFTDEFYAAATSRLGAAALPGPKPYYETFERPDVWFEPSEVWEIRGADISISPVHRAAAGRLHANRGLGLRFPRFLRIRDDKSPEEASGPDFIVDLYNKQTCRGVNA